ncbi:hypothetical protein EP7_000423 [Isosphaeraceae bacterium EP7]
MLRTPVRVARSRFSPAIEGLERRAVMAGVGAAAEVAVRMVAAQAAEDTPTPLDQFAPGQTYKGEPGGLYANGSNAAPQALLDAVDAAASQIQPLNSRGRAAANGRVGVIAIGQSTTNQWFPYFQRLARSKQAEQKAGTFYVNGGQDGQGSAQWAYGNATWATLSRRVGSAARLQVQVLVLDSVQYYPQNAGRVQALANSYSGQLATIVARAKRAYPNLKLVYALPYHWAGAASANKTVTEPGGYELQFGTRQLVTTQSYNQPVTARGPEIWAQTRNPALYYDGVHFTTQGRQTMAEITYGFLKADRAAARWLFR